ncbi:putative ubiquitin-conjugating enzyme E2 25 [Artemisia annua]|uniref:Putative ubiquitin-conjugating enzyme E2 25 n=1 Tax=Artemisia annua TaxID=35608 RepID=A0A2U1LI70_ARTAN|nr:putative ubiquitin-conjugating enzyme E2 25 [Artemisia annua]
MTGSRKSGQSLRKTCLILYSSYPECPPLLWYHSGGLDINPNLLPGGGVELSLPKINGQGIEVDKMWVPGSSNMLKLLVSVKDQIPFLKSLKTMVYIMNKQPKNFEDFVVGHFRSWVRDILMACQAYMDGMPVGCFGVQMDEEEGNNKAPCTIEFKRCGDIYQATYPLFLGIGYAGTF